MNNDQRFKYRYLSCVSELSIKVTNPKSSHRTEADRKSERQTWRL